MNQTIAESPIQQQLFQEPIKTEILGPVPSFQAVLYAPLPGQTLSLLKLLFPQPDLRNLKLTLSETSTLLSLSNPNW